MSEAQNSPEIKCPKCESNQIFAGKKGFSGKKAVAGAVLSLIMKDLLLTALIIICIPSFGQEIISTKNDVVFYEGKDSASGTKSELYSKAKVWLAKTAASAKDAIQLDDANAGTLIAKGFFNVRTTGLGAATWDVYCTIIIDCRDQKFRIQLSDFYYTGDGIDKHSIDNVYRNYEKGKMKKANGNFLIAVDEGAKNLMASFKLSMKNKQDDF